MERGERDGFFPPCLASLISTNSRGLDPISFLHSARQNKAENDSDGAHAKTHVQYPNRTHTDRRPCWSVIECRRGPDKRHPLLHISACPYILARIYPELSHRHVGVSITVIARASASIMFIKLLNPLELTARCVSVSQQRRPRSLVMDHRRFALNASLFGHGWLEKDDFLLIISAGCEFQNCRRLENQYIIHLTTF